VSFRRRGRQHCGRENSWRGKRVLGPERAPAGLVVGHFTDPEGNLIGVAGTQ